MSILETIKKDQIQARLSKNKVKASILTLLISEIEIIGINDGKRESTDIESVSVLKKFISNANTSITDMAKKNIDNSEKHNELMIEIETITVYVPKQLTDDELYLIIQELVKDGMDNIGMLMKHLKSNYAGLYNGSMASVIIRDVLQNKVLPKK